MVCQTLPLLVEILRSMLWSSFSVGGHIWMRLLPEKRGMLPVQKDYLRPERPWFLVFQAYRSELPPCGPTTVNMAKADNCRFSCIAVCRGTSISSLFFTSLTNNMFLLITSFLSLLLFLPYAVMLKGVQWLSIISRMDWNITWTKCFMNEVFTGNLTASLL